LHNDFPIKGAARLQPVLWYVCVFNEGDPPNADYPTNTAAATLINRGKRADLFFTWPMFHIWRDII
jgi:hypothetical protein